MGGKGTIVSNLDMLLLFHRQVIVRLFRDPRNCSSPGSFVPWISQARVLEWVAISLSRCLPNGETEPTSPGWQTDSLLLSHVRCSELGYTCLRKSISNKRCKRLMFAGQQNLQEADFVHLIKNVKVKSLSCVWLFAPLWSTAHQAPLSMGFSRQEYWSGLPFPSPGDLPNPGIEPRSPALQADALTSESPHLIAFTKAVSREGADIWI